MGCGPCGCGPQSSPDFDPRDEGLSDDDLARFGGDDVACPECGASMYDDAAICHSCGHAMGGPTTRGGAGGGMPLWMGVAAALALIGMLYWTL